MNKIELVSIPVLLDRSGKIADALNATPADFDAPKPVYYSFGLSNESTFTFYEGYASKRYLTYGNSFGLEINSSSNIAMGAKKGAFVCVTLYSIGSSRLAIPIVSIVYVTNETDTFTEIRLGGDKSCRDFSSFGEFKTALANATHFAHVVTCEIENVEH